ncbi:hypothetical protein SteCoe_25843 [Stentor coeruleus]|uniref:Uncharacterized protein n=1 Tax=Stentor coeruleus TaxID=5963 RepID=A0A1R2BEB9_9CILI|nr:hypothetical protein SteCoe_25843 [Stentor coeruleus]
MGEKSLVWVFRSFQYEFSGINILPCILFYHKLPEVILYSEMRNLHILRYPSLADITKIFKSDTNLVSKECFAYGYNKELLSEKLNEEKFNIETQFSKYKVIQASRDKRLLTIHHVVEFKNDHYNSYVYTKKKSNKFPLDDIGIEKSLIKTTTATISSIEASQESFVDFIEIIYFQTPASELILERSEKCITVSAYKERSITRLPIIMNSKQLKPRNSIIQRNFSIAFKPASKLIKPKMKISQSKLNVSIGLFPELNRKNLSTSIFFCNGYYCNLKIQVNSITHKRKVPFRKYIGVYHELIQEALKFINFPISEGVFDEEFDKVYEDLLGEYYGNKKDYFNNSLNKTTFNNRDLVTLCPICFKIFNKAYFKETTYNYYF